MKRMFISCLNIILLKREPRDHDIAIAMSSSHADPMLGLIILQG